MLSDKQRQLLARYGDGFATDPRVLALREAPFALYAEIVLQADRAGIWADYPAGMDQRVALGQAFRPLMERIGWREKSRWKPVMVAYEDLVQRDMLWARDRWLRVYPYWSNDILTTETVPLWTKKGPKRKN